MKVWVDLTASAHPLVFRPLVGLLEAQGHEVEITTELQHRMFADGMMRRNTQFIA